MQIRLTVKATRGGAAARGRDVIVTAPAGTTLGAVAGGLLDAAAAAASGGGGTASGPGGAAVPVYAGQRLLDPDRTLLGEPPLVDGAVLSLGGPADPGHGRPPEADAAAVPSLRVVAGPDAGGVHLLHGGQIRIGRSADADVPLDDPDVSRLHCALTVASDGRITVADLGSTNGTTVDGAAVGRTPVPLAADAVLRVGESALRIASPAGHGGTGSGSEYGAGSAGGGSGPGSGSGSGEHSRVPEQRRPREQGSTTNGLGGGWPAGGGPEYGRTGPGRAYGGGDAGGEYAAGADRGNGDEHGGGPGGPGAGHRVADAGSGHSAAGTDRTHGGGPAARGRTESGRARRGGSGNRGGDAAAGVGYGDGRGGAEGTGPDTGGVGGSAAADPAYRSADRNGPGADTQGTGAGRGPSPAGTDPEYGSAGQSGPGTGGARGPAGADPAYGDERGDAEGSGPGTGARGPGAGRGHGGTDRSGPRAGTRGPGTGAAHGSTAADPRYGSAHENEPGTGAQGPGAGRGHGGADRSGPGAGAAHGSPGADPGYGGGRAVPGRTAPDAGGAYGAGTGAGERGDRRARGRTGDGGDGAERGREPDASVPPRRGGTPTRGTAVPPELRPRGGAAGAARRGEAASVPQPPRRGIRAWARRLGGGREEAAAQEAAAPAAARTALERTGTATPHDRYPDAAAILLAALANEAAYQPGFTAVPTGTGGTAHSSYAYAPGYRSGDAPAHHPAHPGDTVGPGGTSPYPGAPGGAPARPGTPAGPGATGTAGGPPYPGDPAGPDATRTTGGSPHPGTPAGAPARPGDTARPGVTGPAGPTPPGAAAGGPAQPGAAAGGPAGGLVFRRDLAHSDALVLRLGTEFRPGGGTAPVTVDLRRAGSLALAGPRPRLAGLARSVVAQLAALHAPDALELVLISADPTRPHESRVEDWSWAGWLPHVRPRQGQDCRLLLAYDREQAAARVGELQRRLEQPATTPRSVVVVDGDPGTSAVRDAVARLAEHGPAAGVHVVCLAETPSATPASPLTATYAAACEAAPGFAACGAVGLLSGDVATGLRLLLRPGPPSPSGATGDAGSAAGQLPGDTAPSGSAAGSPTPSGAAPHSSSPRGTAPRSPSPRGTAADSSFPGPAAPPSGQTPYAPAPGPSATATTYGTGRVRLVDDDFVAPGEPSAAGGWFEAAASGPGHAVGPAGTVDAVSAAWAERLARALAPYGERDDADGTHAARRGGALPGAVRLLDELDLARATPTALTARWLESRAGAPRVGAVLGAGPDGRLAADLAAGPLAVEGAARGGKSELLRSFAAALAAGEPPERLQLVLVDGAGRERGDALGAAADLPHVSGHLVAADPVRMREFAQELGAEFKRRAALYAPEGESAPQGPAIPGPRSGAEPRPGGAADVQAPQSNTLRLRRQGASGELPGTGTATGAGTTTGTGAATGTGAGAGTGSAAAPGTAGATDPAPHGTPAPGAAAASPRRGGTPPHGTRTPETAPRPGTTPPHGTPSPGIPSPGAPSPGTPGLGAPAPGPARSAPAGRRPALPAVVLLVDDFDALVAPALGSPARPAAGSVVRVVEAIARDGGPLGMHLVTASAQPEKTAGTAAVSGAAHHVVLGGDDVPPGRGLLCDAGAEPVPFQAARVTGRIPRTATARPTVVPLEWARMGSPPTSRPLRELGNGPTDLALLASALQRAAGSATATPAGDARTPSP